MTISNNRYYDEFAANYEVHRHDGYHAFIDELEAELIRRHLPQELPRDGHGLTILEAGCGTGLLLDRLRPHVGRAVGVDLSRGMLRKARARQLEIVQGSVTALPFADASFDLTYSFKVLAHVQEIELALSEMTRVLKPGGMLCAEFYNERSLRYLIKALKPATRTSSEFSDEAIFTRYDTLPRIKSYLPKSVSVEAVYGIRVLTPTAAVHKLPVVAPLLRALEKKAAGLPLLRNFGGFLLIVAKKVTPYP
jgi:ubiquinone/menaquinone biosynthesis C-methylase UbiE